MGRSSNGFEILKFLKFGAAVKNYNSRVLPQWCHLLDKIRLRKAEMYRRIQIERERQVRERKREIDREALERQLELRMLESYYSEGK